ncbi:hypothetical protein ACSSS7_007261 [Eimeria intestinalis]
MLNGVMLPGGLKRVLDSSVKPGGFGLKLHWLSTYRGQSSASWRLNDTECPFLTLGLDPSASPEELRSRYLQLAKQLHPDASADQPSRSASAFLELRKAYEAALQLQQQAKNSTPAQAGQSESSDYWSNWRGCERTGQPKRSAEAEARRREWEKDQEAVRSFWESQATEQSVRRNDSEFSAAMESLLESRLHAENESQVLQKTDRGSSEKAERFSKQQVSSMAKWELEFDDELREYGLEYKRKCSFFSSFLRKECPSSAPSWTSRKETVFSRLGRRLAALSAAVAATGVALLLKCAKTRNEPQSPDLERQQLE